MIKHVKHVKPNGIFIVGTASPTVDHYWNNICIKGIIARIRSISYSNERHKAFNFLYYMPNNAMKTKRQ